MWFTKTRRPVLVLATALAATALQVASASTVGAEATAPPKTTVLVSHVGGAPVLSHAASISGDGNLVAFLGRVGVYWQVYLRDVSAGTTRLVSHKAGSPTEPSSHGGALPRLTPDGAWVVFTSVASDMVAGDGPGYVEDVFAYDVAAGQLRQLTHRSNTDPAWHMRFGEVSDNGRFVTYHDGWRRGISVLDRDADADRVLDEAEPGATSTTLVSGHEHGFGYRPGPISDDGRFLAFASERAFVRGMDVYRVDRGAPSVQVLTAAAPYNWALGVDMTADGQTVVFSTDAPLEPSDTNGHKDVYRWRASGEVTRISSHAAPAADGAFLKPALSADGRRVAYSWGSADSGQGQVFVHDEGMGRSWLVSKAADGSELTRPSGVLERPEALALSADGRFLAYDSDANDIIEPALTCEYSDNSYYDYTLDQWVNTEVSYGECSKIYRADLASSVTPVTAEGGTATAGTADLTTTIAVPPGFPGDVTITPTDAVVPNYSLLGSQVQLSAPAATWDQPLVLTFVLGADAFAGHDHASVEVLRNGEPLPDCIGSATAIQPDPADSTDVGTACVSGRELQPDGTLRLTVLAPQLSTWALGVLTAAPNVAPQLAAPLVPTAPVRVGSAVEATAAFTDANGTDAHTASWSWGDGTDSTGQVREADGSGVASGTHTYAVAGLFPVSATVHDGQASATSRSEQPVVVYDPGAGFVTGGGWVPAPAGAGRVSFDLTSRYLGGASAPAGHVSLRMGADRAFRSTGLSWMVVADGSTTLAAHGTYSGRPATATLTIVDGGRGGQLDRVQARVVQGGEVVFDTAKAGGEALGGGNVTLHTGR